MAAGYVFLSEDSPFFTVFPPQGKAPVVNTVTTEVKLIGSTETEVYMLDVTRCSAAQFIMIANLCAGLLGDTAAIAGRQMRTIGLPIRKSQTNGIV